MTEYRKKSIYYYYPYKNMYVYEKIQKKNYHYLPNP